MIANLTQVKPQGAIKAPINRLWRVMGTNLHGHPNGDNREVKSALARYIEENSPLRMKVPESIHQEGNGSPVEHPSFFSHPQRVLAKISGTEFWAKIFDKAGRDGQVTINDIVEAVNSGVKEGRESVGRAADTVFNVQNEVPTSDEAIMANRILKDLHSEIGRNSTESLDPFTFD